MQTDSRKDSFRVASVLSSVLLLFFALSSCKRQRLFVLPAAHAAPTSRFNFINTYPLDSSLALKVNNAFRNVQPYGSISSWFDFDSTSLANAIDVYNLSQPQLHNASLISNFTVNDDYLIFPITFATGEIINNKPALRSLRYDGRPALDGRFRFRLLNTISSAGGNFTLFAMKEGAGRKLALDTLQNSRSALGTAGQFKILNAGSRELTLKFGLSNFLVYGVQPFVEGKSYLFITCGYPGLSQYPIRLLRMEEDKPETLTEIVPLGSYISSSVDSVASFRIVHSCFTFNEYLLSYNLGAYTNNLLGLSLLANGLTKNTGIFFFTATHDVFVAPNLRDLDPSYVSKYRFGENTLSPGESSLQFIFGNAINVPACLPYITKLEQGKAYTVVTLVPASRTLNLPGALQIKIFPQDRIPVDQKYRLRIINLLAGSSSVSVRRTNGDLLIPNTGYQEASDYAELEGASAGQALTLAVTDQNQAPVTQFNNTTSNLTFNLGFPGSTTGTLYLMGSIDPRDRGLVKPTLDYRVDASNAGVLNFGGIIPSILY